VEIQAAILWAVQNNFFDDVPVEKIKVSKANSRTSSTPQSRPAHEVRNEKAISDPLAAELKDAYEFKQTYR